MPNLYRFEFDVTLTNTDTTEAALLEELTRVGATHRVMIERVNWVGPGGGNPQIFAVAATRDAAHAFLTELFGTAECADDTLAANDAGSFKHGR
jgi:hypothetical protein